MFLPETIERTCINQVEPIHLQPIKENDDTEYNCFKIIRTYVFNYRRFFFN